MNYPQEIYSGKWKGGHCQGIAIDKKNGHMYYSFTTELVKTDLEGKLIGSATGLLAHLGCIAFNEDDGCVYGSLEYKNDSIGRGIEQMHGARAEHQDAFYIARFDVSRIDRVGMDVFTDGVMTAAYLKEVVDDYTAVLPDGTPHRLGCSGIDGVTFAPMFGAARDSRRLLMVAYGVYGDVARQDNDHQVILCYDADELCASALPLDQSAPHHSGPAAPVSKLYAHTGNTTYGVQNMEYDPATGDVLLAVYSGSKPQYPNMPMYVLNGGAAPVERCLRGLNMVGPELTLRQFGAAHESGVSGLDFKYGATGMIALGEGMFYFSEDGYADGEWWTNVRLYRWNGQGFDRA